jgi:hypothetical protein
MSSQPHIDINAHIDAIPGRSIPKNFKMAGIAAMAIGVLGLGFGFATGETAWTWGSFLVALVYILGLTQGGVMYAVIMTLTKAHWGRPLKRIAEAFGLFIPVAYVLLVLFLLLGTGIYPWNPDTILEIGPVDLKPHSEFAWSAKPFWLSKWVFIGRQMLVVGFMFLLSLLYLRNSLKPDLIAAKARIGDKAPGWWNLITGSETDVQKACDNGEKNQQILGVLLAFTYAFGFSFIAYDLMMSLSPWWFANMFGAWTFMSSIWITFAALGIYGLAGRDWLGIRSFVTRTVTHDLGKLCLALCMFWAYTTFAQLLPIWYANMPEETDFLLVRLHLPQWNWLAQVVGVMCFVMPFTVLASRGIKKMKWPFIAICAVIMTGIFLERTLVVMPSIHFGDTFPTMNFLLISIPTFIGFLGLFFTYVTWVLSNMPPVGLTDARLEVHPWDVHIHSADDAHHG